MSAGVVVRRASERDMEAVAALLRETWHDTYDALVGIERVEELSRRRHNIERLSRELAHDDRRFLIAERDGALLGTASATLDGDATLTVERIYVRPSSQREGAGKLLLDAAASAFGAAPQRIWVQAEEGNAKARRFYEREGFCSAGSPRRDLIGTSIMFLRCEGLRPARREDAQDLFGLLALCFAEYPGCYVDPHQDLADLRDPGSSFAAKGGLFLVAEDERGRLRASVGIDLPSASQAELHRLYVRPDQRRRGLGRRLVREGEIFARRFGASRMTFWSDTRFHDAHRLYRRLGYERGRHTRALGDVSNSIEHSFARDL